MRCSLVLLLTAKMRRGWSDRVYSTDASTEGFGLCERQLGIDDVRATGSWCERWSYKQLPPSQWGARTRALHRDPLSDHQTVLGKLVLEDVSDRFDINPTCPEVEEHIIILMGKWDHTNEHITIKEGRSLVLLYRRLGRAADNRGKRHLVFVDNMSLCMSVSKGRAQSYPLFRINQQLSALALAGNFSVRVRWVPSERNPSDGPSRGQIKPGAFQGLFAVKSPQRVLKSRQKPRKSTNRKLVGHARQEVPKQKASQWC